MPNSEPQNPKPLSATVPISRFHCSQVYLSQFFTANKKSTKKPGSHAHKNLWLIKPSVDRYSAVLECYAFYLHQILMPTPGIQPKCYHVESEKTDYVAIKYAANTIPLNQYLNADKTKLENLDWQSLASIHVLAIVTGEIDRRLPNILYDETNEKCIAIDFDLAFYLAENCAKTMRLCEFEHTHGNDHQPWGFAIHYEDFLLPTLNKHFTAGNTLFKSIAMHTGSNETELLEIIKKRGLQKHIFDAIVKLLVIPDFMLRLETETMPLQQNNQPYLHLKHSIKKLLATMLQCPEFRQYLSEKRSNTADLDTICSDLSANHIMGHRNFRHHEKELLQRDITNQFKENMTVLLLLCAQAEKIFAETITRQLEIIEETNYSDIHPALITLSLTRALTASSQTPRTIATISSIITKLSRGMLETIIYDYQSLTTVLRIIQPIYRSLTPIKIASNNNLSLFISTIDQVTTIAELCFRENRFNKTVVYILLNTIFNIPQISAKEKITALSALCNKLPQEYHSDISQALSHKNHTEICYKITKLISQYFIINPLETWPAFMPGDKLTLQRPRLAPLKLKNACTLVRPLPNKQQIPYVKTIIDTYLWNEETFFREILPILHRFKNVAEKLPLYRHMGRQLTCAECAQPSASQLNDPEMQRIQLYNRLAVLQLNLQLSPCLNNTLTAITLLRNDDRISVLRETIEKLQQSEQCDAVKRVCKDFIGLILTPIDEYCPNQHAKTRIPHEETTSPPTITGPTR